MPRGWKHTRNGCSKQRAKTQMDLNLPTYCKVRAQSLQLNLRELTRVIHQICAAIPQQYIHRHILAMSTRYIAVDATPGGCTKY